MKFTAACSLALAASASAFAPAPSANVSENLVGNEKVDDENNARRSREGCIRIFAVKDVRR